jgi:hypothetical protein
MSNFIVPDPPARDRRSALNDLGFGTILGNGSSVSPQWDYFRRRAAEYDDAGRRGVAPNVEPPPGSPEYQNASLQVLGNAAGAPPPSGPIGQMASIAIPMSSGLADATLGQTLKNIGARLAPAAGGILAGGTVLLTPRNTPATTYNLGDGLRAQSAPGQRSVSIERRVNDGLLGTGVGAKWEPLDVDAEIDRGPDDIVRLKINPDQLKAAVGEEMTNRALGVPGGKDNLPPPLPSKIEMRIWTSTDRGLTTTAREASREQVEQVCPNFPKYELYAMEAAAKYKAAGLPNGMEYGRLVHQDVEKRLRAAGIPEIRPELAVREGRSPSFSKGSSRIDIVELHKNHITICVYELKTGGARIPREVVERYSREAGMYWELRRHGYPNVYFIPIRVP